MDSGVYASGGIVPIFYVPPCLVPWFVWSRQSYSSRQPNPGLEDFTNLNSKLKKKTEFIHELMHLYLVGVRNHQSGHLGSPISSDPPGEPKANMTMLIDIDSNADIDRQTDGQTASARFPGAYQKSKELFE